MRVILVTAFTADGYIARHAEELIDWSSKEDKQFFKTITKEAGVIIMGGVTFRTFGRPLPDRRNIVYTRQALDVEGVETTQETPEALLARLEQEGHSQVAIIGGSSIYTTFLKAGLVGELYITVEPLMFGEGVKMLNEPVSLSLELLEVRNLNKNSLLLHYKVITKESP